MIAKPSGLLVREISLEAHKIVGVPDGATIAKIRIRSGQLVVAFLKFSNRFEMRYLRTTETLGVFAVSELPQNVNWRPSR